MPRLSSIAAWAAASAILIIALTTGPAAALTIDDAEAYAFKVRFGATSSDDFFGEERSEAALRVSMPAGARLEARVAQEDPADRAWRAPIAQREVTLTYAKPVAKIATLALSLSMSEERGWSGGDENRSVALRAGVTFSAAEGERQTLRVPGFISEIAVGAFAHNQGPFGADKESGTDLNAELLFRSPSFLRWAGAPRPHIGVTAASEDATSYAYAGVTWDRNLPANFYVYASLGAAVHDGDPLTEDEAAPTEQHRLFLGSRVLMRESAGIGMRFGDHWRAALQVEHLSNVQTADNNEGLDNLGLRVSYRF